MYMDTNEQGEPVWSAHYVMPYGAGEIDLNSPYYSHVTELNDSELPGVLTSVSWQRVRRAVAHIVFLKIRRGRAEHECGSVYVKCVFERGAWW